MGDVAIQLGQHASIDAHQQLDRALADLQGGKVRQEVVADEEAEEDKIVDDTLGLKLERQVGSPELVYQIPAEGQSPTDITPETDSLRTLT